MNRSDSRAIVAPPRCVVLRRVLPVALHVTFISPSPKKLRSDLPSPKAPFTPLRRPFASRKAMSAKLPGLPGALAVPTAGAVVALFFVVIAVERAFFSLTGRGKRDAAPQHGDARRRRLSLASEQWARGLFPSALKVPAPAIQSIMFFQPENTPTEEEIAVAFYDSVRAHLRLRAVLVEYDEHLPEGPLWKLLKLLGLAGDKKVPAMAFEERDDYLLPEHTDEARAEDRKLGRVLTGQASAPSGGPRGPALLLAKHIRTVDVGSEGEILKDLAKHMELDFFDATKALWQIRIYRDPDPEAKHRNAVVFSISHIIGDGISLMKLATKLFQSAETGEQLKFQAPPRWTPHFDSFWDAVKFRLWDAYQMVRSTIHVSAFLFTQDTVTELKVGWYPNYVHNARRTILPFAPLSMDACYALREAAKQKRQLKRRPTINDMLHSLFAGTVATYLRERGDPGFLAAEARAKKGGRGALIRIWTPFMFPHPDFSADPTDDLHNLWSMSSTPLPIHEPTPLARLYKSQEINSNLLKSGHDARAAINTQRLFATNFGWEVQGVLNMRATTAHTLTWSNVPGFHKDRIAIWNPSGKGPVRVVDDAMFVLSTPTPYLTSHSYASRLNVCLCADPEKVEDPARFAEIFGEQFRELAAELGVEVAPADRS
ncbi:hypothetical protein DFJ74DRAFT_669523, partial [Hyaloraphidium curvatum]